MKTLPENGGNLGAQVKSYMPCFYGPILYCSHWHTATISSANFTLLGADRKSILGHLVFSMYQPFMDRECIIHIGMPKAGSTSIQNFMFAHRQYLLENHDVNYYAERACHSHLGDILRGRNKKEFLNHYHDLEQETAQFAIETLKYFKKELRTNISKRFVISGERLSRCDVSEVKHLKRITENLFDSTKIIFYARDPYSYAKSSSQQLFKDGFTFQNIQENTYLNQNTGLVFDEEHAYGCVALPSYRLRLEKYIKVFGRQNVIVRDFTRKYLINQDVIDDFLEEILGIKLAKSNFPQIEPDSNPSLDHTAAWTLEQINRLHPCFVLIGDDYFSNPRRARSLTSLIKSNIPAVEKFRLLNFDWRAFIKVISPDLEWLRKATEGRIDFTKLPVPQMEIDHSFDKNSGLANLINELALKSERQNQHIMIMNALRKASSDQVLNQVQLDKIIKQAVSPAPLLKLAKGLKNAGFPEAALKVAQKALYLCRLEPELKDEFDSLVNNLSAS